MIATLTKSILHWWFRNEAGEVDIASRGQQAWQGWMESFFIALDAILSNRLRSALTILGVVIGVAVVALVAALLEGAQSFIAEQAAGLGPGIARIEKASFQDFAGDGQDFAMAQAKRPDITIEELISLRDRLRDRVEVGAQAGAALPLRAGNLSMNGVAIQGVTTNISLLSTLKLERGRELSEFDDQYRREVCVLGVDVAIISSHWEMRLGRPLSLAACPMRSLASTPRWVHRSAHHKTRLSRCR